MLPTIVEPSEIVDFQVTCRQCGAESSTNVELYHDRQESEAGLILYCWRCSNREVISIHLEATNET